MNVSNTKSKNLVLASPLKQNLNKIRNWLRAPKLIIAALTRGGIEDTKLKAKDTKNPRPRPRTALQRTDPLEAKDKNARDQGHNAGLISNKKDLRSKSKNSVALEPRTGHFPGLADFKTKDFKLYLRGLHLGP